MNESGLMDICDSLGLKSSPAHGGSRGLNMSISCPLAPITHGDPNDWNLSCSVSVSDTDPSLVKCFSYNCKFKGNLYEMLRRCIAARGNPPHLIKLLDEIAPTEKFTLESALARSKKRFDEQIDAMRRPKAPTNDKYVLPEARLTRYRAGVPRYALTRGLTLDTCREWELGHDTGRQCLVFPVRRHDGKLVGLTGRHIKYPDAPTKYHNYAGLDKASTLFGESFMAHDTPLIICEGQIDAILTWQYLGIPTVAPLGEGFSLTHVRTITAHSPPVVYLFMDNDTAGRMAAEKIEYALHGRVPISIMLPPEGMDPGAMNKGEMEYALANAKPVLGKIIWDS